MNELSENKVEELCWQFVHKAGTWDDLDYRKRTVETLLRSGAKISKDSDGEFVLKPLAGSSIESTFMHLWTLHSVVGGDVRLEFNDRVVKIRSR